MTISINKTRIMLTINKELKATAQEKALKENRSLNNFIETAIIEYLKRD